jgi:hypothetical protein
MGKKMRKRKLSRKMQVITGKKLAKERKAKGRRKIRTILRESSQDQETQES